MESRERSEMMFVFSMNNDPEIQELRLNDHVVRRGLDRRVRKRLGLLAPG